MTGPQVPGPGKTSPEDTSPGNSAPAITILICAYSRSAVVLECLRRLEHQTFKNFDVVLVDDGSIDDTFAVTTEYAKTAPYPMKVLTQPNGGVGRARNHGLQEITAPLTLLLGQDVWAHPDFVERHVRDHEEHPDDRFAVLGLSRYYDPDRAITPFERYLETYGGQFSYGHFKHGDHVDWRYFYTGITSAKTAFLKRYPSVENIFFLEDMAWGYKMERDGGLTVVYDALAIGDHYHPADVTWSLERHSTASACTPECWSRMCPPCTTPSPSTPAPRASTSTAGSPASTSYGTPSASLCRSCTPAGPWPGSAAGSCACTTSQASKECQNRDQPYWLSVQTGAFMPLNNSQSERGFSPGPALQAVVVLYRCAPEDSPALCGLQSALHADPAAAIRVLVYDNSPAGNPPAPTLPDNIVYLHDPANGGLLAAYTHAQQQAQASGAEWLLLLDQDTQVTADFVQLQLQMVDELAARPTISACVPRLRSAGQLVSPHGPLGLRQDALPAAFTGEAPLGTTAFNSGAMLRRSALQAVGGFPPGYWLDFLDHALFARLARAGFRLWVLPIELDHAMTWEDPAPLHVHRTLRKRTRSRAPLPQGIRKLDRLLDLPSPLRPPRLALPQVARQTLRQGLLAHGALDRRQGIVGCSFGLARRLLVPEGRWRPEATHRGVNKGGASAPEANLAHHAAIQPTAVLRGLPPSLPFARAAFFFRILRDCPPLLPTARPSGCANRTRRPAGRECRCPHQGSRSAGPAEWRNFDDAQIGCLGFGRPPAPRTDRTIALDPLRNRTTTRPRRGMIRRGNHCIWDWREAPRRTAAR